MKKTNRPKKARRFMLFSWRNKGFTLIELIIVMVISGILITGLTVSTGNIDHTSRTANAAFQALSDIRYAQETAMEQGRDVLFSVGANQWSASFQDTGELLNSPSGGGSGLIVHLNAGEYSGVNIDYTQLSTVRFSGTGKPMTSGGVGLTDMRTVLRLNGTQSLYVYPSGYTVLNSSVTSCGCGC
jgi:prepilin-type N-terminal cleavage/methylation domain-containing protein